MTIVTIKKVSSNTEVIFSDPIETSMTRWAWSVDVLKNGKSNISEHPIIKKINRNYLNIYWPKSHDLIMPNECILIPVEDYKIGLYSFKSKSILQSENIHRLLWHSSQSYEIYFRLNDSYYYRNLLYPHSVYLHSNSKIRLIRNFEESLLFVEDGEGPIFKLHLYKKDGQLLNSVNFPSPHLINMTPEIQTLIEGQSLSPRLNPSIAFYPLNGCYCHRFYEKDNILSLRFSRPILPAQILEESNKYMGRITIHKYIMAKYVEANYRVRIIGRDQIEIKLLDISE
ncbi:MAG: hypothetical protein AB7I27_12350 [Bacteriovoracaceae bacterium]